MGNNYINPKFVKNSEICNLSEFGNQLIEYECIGKLGEGTYGIVYKIMDKTTRKYYALKVIQIDKELTREQEAIFFENCDCKNDGLLTPIKIVRSRNEKSYKIGFVLDLMQGDLLYLGEYLGKRTKILLPNLDEDSIIDIFSNMCMITLRGLESLHNKNIIHADLKPENILFNFKSYPKIFENVQYKISDFGFSCFITDKIPQCKKGFYGTLDYIDPICLVFNETFHRKEIDIYAICLTLFSIGYGIFGNKQWIIGVKALFQNIDLENPNSIENFSIYDAHYNFMETKLIKSQFPKKMKNLLQIFFDELYPFPDLIINNESFSTRELSTIPFLRNNDGKYRSDILELITKLEKFQEKYNM